MSKKKPSSRVDDVLRALTARKGQLLTLPEIGQLLHCDPRSVGRACAMLVARGSVVESWANNKVRFGVVDREVKVGVATMRDVVYRGELRHYDTAMRRFAELCMASRS